MQTDGEMREREMVLIFKKGAVLPHTHRKEGSSHQKSSCDVKNETQALSVDTHTHKDKEGEIFNALANALTTPANRPLKEMSSQLPEVCPFD